jgi:hypothetical protein
MERIREKRNAYRVLEWKHEGKMPFGRPRHKWKDNIKYEFKMDNMFHLKPVRFQNTGTLDGFKWNVLY